MNPILMAGSTVVTLALTFYIIGIVSEQQIKQINKKVLTFLSLGLFCDISATTLMIIGSSNSPFTFHGFIGYTGLLAMLTETILAYRFYYKNGSTVSVSKGLHQYSRFALILWVLVYITGLLLVILK